MEEYSVDQLLQWVDTIPLSRPKRNIGRDFADATMMAEVLNHLFPGIVDCHNYSAVNSLSQKKYNWHTLNQRALIKFGMKLSDAEISLLAGGDERTIEGLLAKVKSRLDLGTFQACSETICTPHRSAYGTAVSKGSASAPLRPPSRLCTPVASSRLPLRVSDRLLGSVSRGSPVASYASKSRPVSSENVFRNSNFQTEPFTRSAPSDLLAQLDAKMKESASQVVKLTEENSRLKDRCDKLEQLLAVKDEKLRILQERVAAKPNAASSGTLRLAR